MKQTAEVLFEDKKLGFYLYLIVEAIMFAVLFATYIIFTPASKGAGPYEVFELKTVIMSSLALIPSSATLLIAESGLKKWSPMKILLGLLLTFLLGATFLGLEIHEFYKYATEGYTFTLNNFMSAFYILVGLHASHVAFGLTWMVVLMLQINSRIPRSLFIEKHKIFNYYWHFVDIIWVLIVLIVYFPYLVY